MDGRVCVVVDSGVALWYRRAVGQTRRMEADRAVVLICLPPLVADSYRLRVTSVCRGVKAGA